MTSAAPGPQVNYFTGQEGNSESAEIREKPYQQEQRPLADDGIGAGPSGGIGGVQQQRIQHICIVCGDESDGLHFGQFTCRACAAFFRRTVSLKLHYTCKRDQDCDVDKTARNMCRACRYQKCLEQGMLTSAVQHARDGIGKRTKSAQKISTSSSSDTPDIKMPKGSIGRAPMGSPPGAVSSSSIGQHSFLQPSLNNQPLIGIQQPAQQFVAYGQQSPSLLEQTLLQLNASGQAAFISPGQFSQQPQQQQPYPISGNGSPYLVGNFTNLLGQSTAMPVNAFSAAQQAQPQQQPSTSSNVMVPPELKYLGRMLEGYQHFLSLRKASYTLVEGFPLNKRDDEDCPQSNFGTSKKICKIEASLIMDTVEKFFCPFSQLPAEDKHKMFDPFYCLFSNAERAFRTYKTFGPGDDRLLMPDGGYVRLSELQKFYENNTLVRGDPSQVAKIFENAMQYLVKTVVAHMRNIEIVEMELMALFGMFIWNDSEEISNETQQLVLRVRNEIIVDLHLFYRSQGLGEAEITLKTANLFLLIPKLEQSVRLMNDNYCISELFNMLKLEGACRRANRCAFLNGD